MDDLPLWQQQCNAARSIKDRFGVDKAMGYLLGEKLLQYLHDADGNPALKANLDRFVAEARSIFTDDELRRYFAGPRAVGALGHVLDAKELEVFRAAGAVREDISTSAQDAIRFERMRDLLLPK